MQQPLISSLLDTDAYKLNMQQAIFHHYPLVTASAQFHCRSDEDLSFLKAELQQQVFALAALKFSQDELDYLASLGLYQTDYLEFLAKFSLNPKHVRINVKHDQLTVTITGPWLDIILWEVPLLAVICELRNQHRYPEATLDQALARLDDKLAILAQADSDFKFVDFGTRRRFSRKVHYAIVEKLASESLAFAGTSNLWLAKQYQLNAVGTQAHEWFQAHQQLAGELASSQQLALHRWLQEYPDKLGIALTDCINMDAFLHDFSPYLSQQFTGLRHDSGDPIVWGEKALHHYHKLSIDPLSKTLVFSDGLTMKKALQIYHHFAGRINISFGIGTQLTCDLPGVTTLNVVIKLVSCNGKPVAKISDEPGKSICQDHRYLSKLKRAFNL